MNLKIELSIQNYDRMLEKCNTSSGEHRILVNGRPVQRSRQEKFDVVMKIICNTNDATRLLAFADRICPEAAREIESSLDFCREG
jgi:hypothetical protein